MSIKQYLAGIPALKFGHFRAYGTKFPRFVHFEQPATVQLGEIDIFVIFDPKKLVPRVHHGFVNSDHPISIQATRSYVVLLRGHKLCSHAKIQVARMPRRRI